MAAQKLLFQDSCAVSNLGMSFNLLHGVALSRSARIVRREIAGWTKAPSAENEPPDFNRTNAWVEGHAGFNVRKRSVGISFVEWTQCADQYARLRRSFA